MFNILLFYKHIHLGHNATRFLKLKNSTFHKSRRVHLCVNTKYANKMCLLQILKHSPTKILITTKKIKFATHKTQRRYILLQYDNVLYTFLFDVFHHKYTHVVHCANGIVRVDNDAVLIADRSRLQFVTGRPVVRFRMGGHVIDVPDAFVQDLDRLI